MLEILFLLLPVAAVYGWYMGNQSAQQDKQEHSNQIARQYVTGLNLIFSKESDKAIDHFIELLKVNDETIDTHLALGNLFRSRGEVDRAIHIHQNLISHSSLSINQKNLALQQLAKDYMVSGFLDRAEKIFQQLSKEPDYEETSLKQLVAIHQQTREWSKAIQYASLLTKLGQKKVHSTIAHFWCELAEQEKTEECIAKSIQYFQRALSEDPKCVRASISLGRLFLELKDYRKAMEYLKRILEQDVDFVVDMLPALADCYRHLGQENDLVVFLRECIARKAGVSAVLMLSQLLAKHEDIGAAKDLLTSQLIANPTIKGFYRLMDYHLETIEEGRLKESFNTLHKLLAEQLKVKPHYCCRRCGFSTRSIYWHCPSCKGWGTIKHIRGLDGE
ncbi:rotidine 5'-phosphate decarboxylase [Candidatus Photodesmus blepharus]|uniref:Lipopolysaccharide assembly protein B n=1 Tax=Candidatus Photodesmus blepharonis TaxID=1179155 RepID=A0A084CMB2_9GAMM|nr:lipopolysaccharide assembly protein LapB [Candidatus Photodesmus blepharus]KEY90941.1 rotidine 5'-phosphate decarboxylase [Candidatus Photodesmus blepharus]